jgi:hypothetical protein
MSYKYVQKDDLTVVVLDSWIQENLSELYGFKSRLVFSLAIIPEIIFPEIGPKVQPKWWWPKQ